jgi:gamma-glutamyl phosphate reductase
MLTEYEVRHSVAEITLSQASAARKVRLLLKLARNLKRQARTLLHARALSAQATDCNTATHLDRMVRSLRSQYEDVRLAAHRIGGEIQSEAPFDLALA